MSVPDLRNIAVADAPGNCDKLPVVAKLLPLLCLALGGAAGTLARYGTIAAVDQLFGRGGWPWGTVVVNAAGSLLFGVLFGVLQRSDRLGPIATLTLLGGFCGAFTTFSTYAFDTLRLTTTAGVLQGVGNMLLHNTLALGLMAAGLLLGQRLFIPR